MAQQIAWNREKLIALQAAYDVALAASADKFTVTLPEDGEVELDIGYAKYLIEFVSGGLDQAEAAERELAARKAAQ